jgi:hypothetical protein
MDGGQKFRPHQGTSENREPGVATLVAMLTAGARHHREPRCRPVDVAPSGSRSHAFMLDHPSASLVSIPCQATEGRFVESALAHRSVAC